MMAYERERKIIKEKIYTVRTAFLPFKETIIAINEIEAIKKAIYKYGYKIININKCDRINCNCKVNNKYYNIIAVSL